MTEQELKDGLANSAHSFIKRNLDFFAGHATATKPSAEPESPVAGKFIIKPTTDEAELNKTEAAYLDYLRASGKYDCILVQAITLKLGDGCRYTPDMFTIDKEGAGVFHEVKGFWRDDARVKIKTAARKFSFCKFVAIQRQKKDWIFEAINP
jgi:hypothetical protein